METLTAFVFNRKLHFLFLDDQQMQAKQKNIGRRVENCFRKTFLPCAVWMGENLHDNRDKEQCGEKKEKRSQSGKGKRVLKVGKKKSFEPTLLFFTALC